MNINIRPFNTETLGDSLLMASWEQDSKLHPFIFPLFDLERGYPERTAEKLQDDIRNQPESIWDFMIEMDGKAVGHMQINGNFPSLFLKEDNTAWIGITIGDESCRGKGVGTQAIQLLEQVIQEKGFKRIELGVFEYNIPAINLYSKLGYQEIGRIPEFTHYQDKKWSDIRMEKRWK